MATVRFKLGGFWVEVEGDSPKDIFDEADRFLEIFSFHTCGVCGCTEVYPARRSHTNQEGETNIFYEMKCSNNECRATISYGTRRSDQQLFPHRKDKEKNWLPNNGWSKYVPQQQAQPRQQVQQTQAPAASEQHQAAPQAKDVPF